MCCFARRSGLNHSFRVRLWSASPFWRSRLWGFQCSAAAFPLGEVSRLSLGVSSCLGLLSLPMELRPRNCLWSERIMRRYRPGSSRPHLSSRHRPARRRQPTRILTQAHRSSDKVNCAEAAYCWIRSIAALRYRLFWAETEQTASVCSGGKRTLKAERKSSSQLGLRACKRAAICNALDLSKLTEHLAKAESLWTRAKYV